MILPSSHQLTLLAQSSLAGSPNVGEGMAIRLTERGEYLLYVAHESPPMAVSIVDVSDPERPHVRWQLPAAHPHVRANSLTFAGNTLLVAQQTDAPGLRPAGLALFDLTEDPAAPQQVGFFDASGPHSQGVHFVTCMDGRHAFIATGMPDFQPRNRKDHQFLVIVDVADPREPREVGRWWLSGQRLGDQAPALERHPRFDTGFRLHHALSYPERADRAYLGYIDGGIVILDVSDMAAPTLVSQLDYHPPAPGFTHTVVPLFERELLVVSDEAIGDEGLDWPKRTWLVDVSDETAPRIVSHVPDPEGFEDLHRAGGRIGAHNLHENEPWRGTAKLVNTVATTWFSAGVRIYDIRDPHSPSEIASFIPPTPAGQRASRINDVTIDDRRIVYAGDRSNGGLYVLAYSGSLPLT